MVYPPGSTERRLLDNDPDAIGSVIRWIALTLTSPRFWSLREERHDLFQEVLTRVLESLRRERYDHHKDFRVYVQAVARYTAFQALNRQLQFRSGSASAELLEAQFENPEAQIVKRQLVRKVLDMVSPDCRRLIRSYFLEECSYSEIAAALKIPEGTVKSRLFRCMQSACRFLRQRLPRGRERALD